jgi:hypothetical protein
MPSARSSTGVGTTPSAARARSVVVSSPEQSGTASLDDASRRSTAVLTDALDQLVWLQLELPAEVHLESARTQSA